MAYRRRYRHSYKARYAQGDVVEKDVKCPECGSPMKKKLAIKGANAGGYFYGCSRYPICKGARDYLTAFNDVSLQKKEPKALPEQIIKLNAHAIDKLKNLIKYYKECVQTEALDDIECYSSLENKEFIQCASEKEWMCSGKEKIEIDDAVKLRLFGSNLRWKKKSASYYYAYPTYVHTFKRTSGEKSATILPLLIFPVSAESANGKLTLDRTDIEKPQVNTQLLKKMNISMGAEQKREFLRSLLSKWDEAATMEDNIKNVILHLKEELGPEIFYDEKLDTLVSDNVDLNNVKEGFYSTGVVFITQGSQYTYGLEEELSEMEKKVAEGDTSLPVIGAIMEREQDAKNEEEHLELIEITPLNDEQRESVKSAMTRTPYTRQVVSV